MQRSLIQVCLIQFLILQFLLFFYIQFHHSMKIATKNILLRNHRQRIMIPKWFLKTRVLLNEALSQQNYRQFQTVVKSLKSAQEVLFFAFFIFEEDIYNMSNIQKILQKCEPELFLQVVVTFLNQNLIDKFNASQVRNEQNKNIIDATQVQKQHNLMEQYFQVNIKQTQKITNYNTILAIPIYQNLYQKFLSLKNQSNQSKPSFFRKQYLNINRQIMKTLLKNIWKPETITKIIQLFSKQVIFNKMFQVNFDLEQLKLILPIIINSKIQLQYLNQFVQKFYLPLSKTLKCKRIIEACQTYSLNYNSDLCWKQDKFQYFALEALKNSKFYSILTLNQIGLNISHVLAQKGKLTQIKYVIEQGNSNLIDLFNQFSSQGLNFLDICLKEFIKLKIDQVIGVCKGREIYFSVNSLHHILLNRKLSKIQKQEMIEYVLACPKIVKCQPVIINKNSFKQPAKTYNLPQKGIKSYESQVCSQSIDKILINAKNNIGQTPLIVYLKKYKQECNQVTFKHIYPQEFRNVTMKQLSIKIQQRKKFSSYLNSYNLICRLVPLLKDGQIKRMLIQNLCFNIVLVGDAIEYQRSVNLNTLKCYREQKTTQWKRHFMIYLLQNNLHLQQNNISNHQIFKKVVQQSKDQKKLIYNFMIDYLKAQKFAQSSDSLIQQIRQRIYNNFGFRVQNIFMKIQEMKNILAEFTLQLIQEQQLRQFSKKIIQSKKMVEQNIQDYTISFEISERNLDLDFKKLLILLKNSINFTIKVKQFSDTKRKEVIQKIDESLKQIYSIPQLQVMRKVIYIMIKINKSFCFVIFYSLHSSDVNKLLYNYYFQTHIFVKQLMDQVQKLTFKQQTIKHIIQQYSLDRQNFSKAFIIDLNLLITCLMLNLYKVKPITFKSQSFSQDCECQVCSQYFSKEKFDINMQLIKKSNFDYEKQIYYFKDKLKYLLKCRLYLLKHKPEAIRLDLENQILPILISVSNYCNNFAKNTKLSQQQMSFLQQINRIFAKYLSFKQLKDFPNQIIIYKIRQCQSMNEILRGLLQYQQEFFDFGQKLQVYRELLKKIKQTKQIKYLPYIIYSNYTIFNQIRIWLVYQLSGWFLQEVIKQILKPSIFQQQIIKYFVHRIQFTFMRYSKGIIKKESNEYKEFVFYVDNQELSFTCFRLSQLQLSSWSYFSHYYRFYHQQQSNEIQIQQKQQSAKQEQQQDAQMRQYTSEMNFQKKRQLYVLNYSESNMHYLLITIFDNYYESIPFHGNAISTLYARKQKDSKQKYQDQQSDINLIKIRRWLISSLNVQQLKLMLRILDQHQFKKRSFNYLFFDLIENNMWSKILLLLQDPSIMTDFCNIFQNQRILQVIFGDKCRVQNFLKNNNEKTIQSNNIVHNSNTRIQKMHQFNQFLSRIQQKIKQGKIQKTNLNLHFESLLQHCRSEQILQFKFKQLHFRLQIAILMGQFPIRLKQIDLKSYISLINLPTEDELTLITKNFIQKLNVLKKQKCTFVNQKKMDSFYEIARDILNFIKPEYQKKRINSCLQICKTSLLKLKQTYQQAYKSRLSVIKKNESSTIYHQFYSLLNSKNLKIQNVISFIQNNKLKLNYQFFQKFYYAKGTNLWKFITSLYNEKFVIDFIKKYNLFQNFLKRQLETTIILQNIYIYGRSSLLKFLIDYLKQENGGQNLKFKQAFDKRQSNKFNQICKIQGKIVYLPIISSVSFGFLQYHYLAKSYSPQIFSTLNIEDQFMKEGNYLKLLLAQKQNNWQKKYDWIPQMKKKMDKFQKVYNLIRRDNLVKIHSMGQNKPTYALLRSISNIVYGYLGLYKYTYYQSSQQFKNSLLQLIVDLNNDTKQFKQKGYIKTRPQFLRQISALMNNKKLYGNVPSLKIHQQFKHQGQIIDILKQIYTQNFAVLSQNEVYYIQKQNQNFKNSLRVGNFMFDLKIKKLLLVYHPQSYSNYKKTVLQLVDEFVFGMVVNLSYFQKKDSQFLKQYLNKITQKEGKYKIQISNNTNITKYKQKEQHQLLLYKFRGKYSFFAVLIVINYLQGQLLENKMNNKQFRLKLKNYLQIEQGNILEYFLGELQKIEVDYIIKLKSYLVRQIKENILYYQNYKKLLKQRSQKHLSQKQSYLILQEKQFYEHVQKLIKQIQTKYTYCKNSCRIQSNFFEQLIKKAFANYKHKQNDFLNLNLSIIYSLFLLKLNILHDVQQLTKMVYLAFVKPLQLEWKSFNLSIQVIFQTNKTKVSLITYIDQQQERKMNLSVNFMAFTYDIDALSFLITYDSTELLNLLKRELQVNILQSKGNNLLLLRPELNKFIQSFQYIKDTTLTINKQSLLSLKNNSQMYYLLHSLTWNRLEQKNKKHLIQESEQVDFENQDQIYDKLCSIQVKNILHDKYVNGLDNAYEQTIFNDLITTGHLTKDWQKIYFIFYHLENQIKNCQTSGFNYYKLNDLNQLIKIDHKTTITQIQLMKDCISYYQLLKWKNIGQISFKFIDQAGKFRFKKQSISEQIYLKDVQNYLSFFESKVANLVSDKKNRPYVKRNQSFQFCQQFLVHLNLEEGFKIQLIPNLTYYRLVNVFNKIFAFSSIINENCQSFTGTDANFHICLNSFTQFYVKMKQLLNSDGSVLHQFQFQNLQFYRFLCSFLLGFQNGFKYQIQQMIFQMIKLQNQNSMNRIKLFLISYQINCPNFIIKPAFSVKKFQFLKQQHKIKVLKLQSIQLQICQSQILKIKVNLQLVKHEQIQNKKSIQQNESISIVGRSYSSRIIFQRQLQKSREFINFKQNQIVSRSYIFNIFHDSTFDFVNYFINKGQLKLKLSELQKYFSNLGHLFHLRISLQSLCEYIQKIKNRLTFEYKQVLFAQMGQRLYQKFQRQIKRFLNHKNNRNQHIFILTHQLQQINIDGQQNILSLQQPVEIKPRRKYFTKAEKKIQTSVVFNGSYKIKQISGYFQYFQFHGVNLSSTFLLLFQKDKFMQAATHGMTIILDGQSILQMKTLETSEDIQNVDIEAYRRIFYICKQLPQTNKVQPFSHIFVVSSYQKIYQIQQNLSKFLLNSEDNDAKIRINQVFNKKSQLIIKFLPKKQMNESNQANQHSQQNPQIQKQLIFTASFGKKNQSMKFFLNAPLQNTPTLSIINQLKVNTKIVFKIQELIKTMKLYISNDVKVAFQEAQQNKQQFIQNLHMDIFFQKMNEMFKEVFYIDIRNFRLDTKISIEQGKNLNQNIFLLGRKSIFKKHFSTLKVRFQSIEQYKINSKYKEVEIILNILFIKKLVSQQSLDILIQKIKKTLVLSVVEAEITQRKNNFVDLQLYKVRQFSAKQLIKLIDIIQIFQYQISQIESAASIYAYLNSQIKMKPFIKDKIKVNWRLIANQNYQKNYQKKLQSNNNFSAFRMRRIKLKAQTQNNKTANIQPQIQTPRVNRIQQQMPNTARMTNFSTARMTNTNIQQLAQKTTRLNLSQEDAQNQLTLQFRYNLCNQDRQFYTAADILQFLIFNKAQSDSEVKILQTDLSNRQKNETNFKIGSKYNLYAQNLLILKQSQKPTINNPSIQKGSNNKTDSLSDFKIEKNFKSMTFSFQTSQIQKEVEQIFFIDTQKRIIESEYVCKIINKGNVVSKQVHLIQQNQTYLLYIQIDKKKLPQLLRCNDTISRLLKGQGQQINLQKINSNMIKCQVYQPKNDKIINLTLAKHIRNIFSRTLILQNQKKVQKHFKLKWNYKAQVQILNTKCIYLLYQNNKYQPQNLQKLNDNVPQNYNDKILQKQTLQRACFYFQQSLIEPQTNKLSKIGKQKSSIRHTKKNVLYEQNCKQNINKLAVKDKQLKFITSAGNQRRDIVQFRDQYNIPIAAPQNIQCNLVNEFNKGQRIYPQVEYIKQENSKLILKWRSTTKGSYSLIINETNIEKSYSFVVCSHAFSPQHCAINMKQKQLYQLQDEIELELILKDQYGNIYNLFDNRHYQHQIMNINISLKEEQKSKYKVTVINQSKINQEGKIRLNFTVAQNQIVQFQDKIDDNQSKVQLLNFSLNLKSQKYQKQNVFQFKLKFGGINLKKRNQLLRKQLANISVNQFTIQVPRTHIIKHLYKEFKGKKYFNYKFYIVFKNISGHGNQKGIDGGGLTRQFYDLLGAELKEIYFKIVDLKQEDYFIDIKKIYDKSQAQYFQFIGMLIANSILTNNLLGIKFSPVFLKLLYGEKLNYKDFFDVFSKKQRESYQQILLYSKQELEAVCEVFSKKINGKEVQLKQNGKEILVTVQNRMEYFTLLTQKYFSLFTEFIIKFREGFQKLIPLHLINKYIRNNQFWSLTNGQKRISKQAILQCTVYYPKNKMTMIDNFEKYINETDQKTLTNFMKFTTGRSTISFEMKQEIKVKFNEASHKLPLSHTCFYTIQIPCYSTYQIFKEKMDEALPSCQGFDFA